MSALTSAAASTSRRPILTALPRLTRQMNALTFVLVLGAILAAGMFGLLLLNTQIQEQGFTVNQLNAEAASRAEEEASLRTRLNGISSSSELVRRASELGMVPYAQPGYLELPSGKVIGAPKPGNQADVSHIKTDRVLLEEARARAEAQAAAEAKAKAEAEAKAKAEAEAAAKAKAEAESAAKNATASPQAASPTATNPTAQPTKKG